MSGCPRIFDHTTFPEVHWSRSEAQQQEFILPPGFESVRALFSKGIIEVLEDLNAFRCLRESEHLDTLDPKRLVYIDNAQAWNESRLLQLQASADNYHPVVNCCLTAAYVCSYALFSEIWSGTFITSRLSKQLLQQVNESISSIENEDYTNLLVWLVYIGAAFSADHETRLGFRTLVRSLSDMWNCMNTWEQTLSVLRLFVWSDAIFLDRCRAVWEESHGDCS